MSYPKSKHYKITPAGSGSSGGGVPGGADKSIQINNAGAFGGSDATLDVNGFTLINLSALGGLKTARSKYQHYDRILGHEVAVPVTGFNNTAILAAEIPDDATVTLEITWNVQRWDGNTGHGGKLISTWRKTAGVLTKVGDQEVGVSNNTGDVITVGTAATGGGDLQFTWSRAGIQSYYYGVHAFVNVLHL